MIVRSRSNSDVGGVGGGVRDIEGGSGGQIVGVSRGSPSGLGEDETQIDNCDSIAATRKNTKKAAKKQRTLMKPRLRSLSASETKFK